MAKTEAPTREAVDEGQTGGLTRFDPEKLKGIGSQELVTSSGAVFLPQNMAEAMELGKLMALSNFVPPHLRNKPGDCLAVVLISSRWAMDPFAVASKTYFVSDRMAYESQLVNAVLNTRAPLDGRLHIEWDGEGEHLICKVTGKIKGDPVPHAVWQELKSITTRNSPLWKQSPRQQIAYYTTRMWGRLFCPEVLLGVYTEDEIEDMGDVQRQADGSEVIPPKPTREGLKKERESAVRAAEQLRREEAEAAARGTGRMPDDEGREDDDAVRDDGTPPHDPKTGELHEETKPKAEPAKAAEPKKDTAADHANSAKALMDKFKRASKRSALEALVEEYAMEIDVLRTESRSNYDAVMAAVGERRRYFER